MRVRALKQWPERCPVCHCPEMDMRVRALKHKATFITTSKSPEMDMRVRALKHFVLSEWEDRLCPEMDMRVRALKHNRNDNPARQASRDGHACTRAETF